MNGARLAVNKLTPDWRVRVALAVLIAGMTAYTVRWGTRMHAVIPDELQAIAGGRAIAGDPLSALFTDAFFDRGVERLTAVVAALFTYLLSGAPAALTGLHLFVALMACLTAWPAFMIARRVGAGTGYALAAATLVVAAPWLVYGATLLTASVAYFLTTLFVYLLWCTSCRPSHRVDVALLAVMAVSAATRAGQMAFFVVPVIVLVVQTWRDRPTGGPHRTALVGLVPRLARQHPVLVAGGGIAVVGLAVIGPDAVIGTYLNTSLVRSGNWVEASWIRTQISLAQLAVGTGLLPLMIGAPWVIRESIRPRSREGGIFALIALSVFIAYVISSAHAAIEDRYVYVIAAIPVIAFVVALGRRETSVIGVAVAAVVLWAVVRKNGLAFPTAPLDYFIAPARASFTYARDQIFGVGGLLPVGHTTLAVFACVGLFGLVVGAARSPRALRFGSGRLGSTLPALGIGLVLLYGIWSAQWAVSNFVNKFGVPTYSFAGTAFVDRATGGQDTGILVTGDPAQSFTLWNDIAFNESIVRSMQFFRGSTSYRTTFGLHPNLEIDVDRVSGRLQPVGSIPRHIVQTGSGNVGFVGRVVGRSDVFSSGQKQFVTRLDSPPRLSWRASSLGVDGRLPVGKSVDVTIFRQSSAGAASLGRCFRAGVEPGMTPGTLYVTGPNRKKTALRIIPGKPSAINLRVGVRPARQQIRLYQRAAAGAVLQVASGAVLRDAGVAAC